MSDWTPTEREIELAAVNIGRKEAISILVCVGPRIAARACCEQQEWCSGPNADGSPCESCAEAWRQR